MGSRAREGGWGWCVTFASFLVHVIVGGITYSCGVFQMIFINYFEESRFRTSWISAILMAFTVVGGIPSTIISYKYGYRTSVLVGSMLSACGFTVSLFCTELYELYFAMGVMGGLGFGLALTPSVMVLENYFFEKRHFAAGIATTGTFLGIVVFPVVIYHMEELFAWKGMSLIMIAICANLFMCGLTMRPQRTPGGHRKRRDLIKIFDATLCRSPAFGALLASNVLWSCGVSVVFTYLAEYSTSTGASADEAVTLIGVVGVSALVSRVVFQMFSHSAKLDNASNALCSVGLLIILTALFPEFFKHRAGQIGYAIMFGLHCGFWGTFVATVAADLLSEQLVAFSRGYISLSIGLGLAGGPPLAGWLLDCHDNFEIIFYGAGSCMLLSSVLMLAVSIKKCYYRPPVDDNSTESSSSLSRGSSAPSSGTSEDEQMMVTSILTAL